MLRSLLGAFATAQAASKVRRYAKQTTFGALAALTLLVAFVFAALAAFFALSGPLGSAGAAAVVAGGLAIVAALVALWSSTSSKKAESSDLLGTFDLQALGIKNKDDVEAVVKGAQKELRKVNPVTLGVVALVAGFVIARRL